MSRFSVSILLLLLAGTAAYAQTAPSSAEEYVARGYEQLSKRDYFTKRDYDGAIADFTKAIELNPRLAGAYN